MRACPFCGSGRLENIDAAMAPSEPVHCIDCGARGPVKHGFHRGIEAWDFRADEELLDMAESVLEAARAVRGLL